AGCGTGKAPSAATAASTPALPRDSTLTFVLSGDTAGFIVPCGCTTKQFGGLPRRATYLKEALNKFGPRLIYLDAGGSVQHGTAYDELKLEYILRGVNKMHLSAHNLGAGEMSLKPESLAAEGAFVTLLSTHVMNPPSSA